MSDPNLNAPPRPAATVLTAAAASALAALAVLALVGVLVLVFGQRAGPGSLASTRVTQLPADPGLSPRPATPSSGSGSTGSGMTGSGTSAPETTVPAGVKVVVLNATSRRGLAARFQRLLRARGWAAVSVGNFSGGIPVTTVYYPPGQQAAAEALAAQFDDVERVRPAFSGISQTRLTVILTRDLS
jgi:LytR cell envelope-related transcriptional attenuator